MECLAVSRGMTQGSEHNHLQGQESMACPPHPPGKTVATAPGQNGATRLRDPGRRNPLPRARPPDRARGVDRLTCFLGGGTHIFLLGCRDAARPAPQRATALTPLTEGSARLLLIVDQVIQRQATFTLPLATALPRGSAGDGLVVTTSVVFVRHQRLKSPLRTHPLSLEELLVGGVALQGEVCVWWCVCGGSISCRETLKQINTHQQLQM